MDTQESTSTTDLERKHALRTVEQVIDHLDEPWFLKGYLGAEVVHVIADKFDLQVDHGAPIDDQFRQLQSLLSERVAVSA